MSEDITSMGHCAGTNIKYEGNWNAVVDLATLAWLGVKLKRIIEPEKSSILSAGRRCIFQACVY